MGTERGTQQEQRSHRDPVSRRYYRTGLAVYGLCGLCAISPGIIVSILQDHYGLRYSLMGSMVSMLSVGNMLGIYASGVLPARLGERRTTLLLGTGFFLGFLLMSLTGSPVLLLSAFFLAGIARGVSTNKCTVMVGNYAEDRTKGVAMQNVFFAIGALLCPVVIGICGAVGNVMHTGILLQPAGLAAAGSLSWILLFRAGLPEGSFKGEQEAGTGSNAFLRDPAFWLLTLMIFCSMGVENSVNGWLVSYYKSEGILSGTLSTYTTTIQWLTILISRLLTTFVLRPKNLYRAVAGMSAAVTCTMLALVSAERAAPAILALILYSLAVGGIFPTSAAGIGERMNSQTVGVMLSAASTSSIFFPWLIGVVADHLGIRAGMRVILVPCMGVLLISLYMWRRTAAER